MLKSLFFISLFYLVVGCVEERKDENVFLEEKAVKELEDAVFICNSEYATKFHYIKNCEGLVKCTHFNWLWYV